MDLELDPFADLLSEPVVINARAGTKFQPKAKPRPKKETSVSVPSTSSLSDSTKEKSTVAASGHVDTSKPMSPSADRTQVGSNDLALPSVDTSSKLSCGTVPIGPLLHLENREALNSTGLLHLNFSESNVDRSSAPLNISPRHATTEGDLNSTYTSQLGDTITSDIHGDMLVGFERSEGETADFFCELESLDDILSQPAISNVNSARKFQPKVKANAQPRNKLPISRSFMIDAERSVSHSETPSFHVSNAEGMEVDPSLPVVSSVNSIFRACSSMQTDTAHDFLVSKELLNSREPAASYNGDLWTDNGRVEREEEVFPGLESFNVSPQATTTPGDAHLVPSENEYLDADLTPAYPSDGYIDFSNVRFSDYVSTDTPSEFQVTKDSANLDDVSGTEVPIPVEMVDSQTVNVMSGKENTESGKSQTAIEDPPGLVYSADVEGISKGTMDDRPVSATSEGNETGKSSRQLRKRSVARVFEEMLDDTSEYGDLLYEPSNDSLGDIDDNNDNGGEASNHKRTHKKSKKPIVDNEKTVRRRKKSSEGPDSSNKEPPKKKFSHSTRRNKRRVNKVLLETPKEEINLQKLAIKDLILLAEAKERLLSKDAAAAKNSVPNQSRSFTANATYDPFASMQDQDPFASMHDQGPFTSMQDQDPDDDQPTPAVQESTFKLNYHSYMDKIPRERWSKQDTELFYEAIQQFGTDFAMIQQLFPGRTRHQVKLKYKKEERQQPMKLHDALINRSKDNSHFEMVIERLRKASAEADENSVNLTGEEEEVNPETNNEEVDKFDQEGEADTFEEHVDQFDQEGEADTFEEQEKGAKLEQKKEEVTQDSEPRFINREVHCPFKSDENEEDVYENEEDVYNRWSEYKSDYDVF